MEGTPLAGIMYRKNAAVDAQKDNFSPYLGLKCFQEPYLDANMLSSPSISPTLSSGPLSPLSPVMSPQSPPEFAQQQQLNLSSVALTPSSLDGSQNQSMTMSQHLNQQFAVAQQHLALAANQHDEISKSLKMFAMLTAYKTGNESSTQPSQVDAVMQDFACNGYASDDANRFQQYQSAQHQFFNQGDFNANANSTASSNSMSAFTIQQLQQYHQSQLQQLQQQQLQNLQFNEGHSNTWNYVANRLPQQQQQQQQQQTQLHLQQKLLQQISSVGGGSAGGSFDYNANKKPPKRYNAKNEKYTSAKHCVFCENNNEPEAVVKSHAVRDSLGRVLCPKLRTYICPICKASGDQAHTVKYCPQKPIITMEDAVKADAFRLSKGTGTYYKQQMKV